MKYTKSAISHQLIPISTLLVVADTLDELYGRAVYEFFPPLRIALVHTECLLGRQLVQGLHDGLERIAVQVLRNGDYLPGLPDQDLAPGLRIRAGQDTQDVDGFLGDDRNHPEIEYGVHYYPFPEGCSGLREIIRGSPESSSWSPRHVG